MQPKRILVFDSGIGGLSIAKELLNYLPDINLDYAFDNAAFPYGNKPKDWLLERILQFIDTALQTSKANLLVIACNTASTLALVKLRQRHDLPIVGVVPGIKPGAELSKTKNIIVLATPNTIASPYTRKLIDDFAINTKVNLIGDADLVSCAENIMRGEKVDMKVIHRVVNNINQYRDSDTIVLACTHYPFLKQLLSENLPKPYNWIDSSMAIVKRTANLLNLTLKTDLDFNISNNNARQNTGLVLTSKAIDSHILKQNLIKLGFNQFNILDIK